jgi:ribosomal protein S24E
LLARKEIQINQALNNGATPLYIACHEDRLKVVNALLARKEIQINQAMNDGRTPLYTACEKDHVKIINMLLARKEIYINQATNDGWTPLHIACEMDHVKVVNVLLARHEIQINQAMNDGRTPLYIACWKGWLRIIELFKRKNDTTNRSSTRMYMNQKRLEGLLLSPASQVFVLLESSFGYQVSPIQKACVENHLDIVLYCIFHGLLTPGMPEFWGLIKVKSWYDRLNTDNKNRLLALAEENRREYDTSYTTFLIVLQNVDTLKKRTCDAAAASVVANTSVARFCSNEPTLTPIHLIADFLCGPQQARLVLNQIILFNQSALCFRR